MRLLIGYGNPLRSDDGLGPWLADRLSDGWEVITTTQLLPEHAEPVSRAARVVFVDAAVGATPGVVAGTAVQPEAASSAFVHHVTPGALLASAQALYGAAPPALLVTVTGADFALGETFSAAIQARLPEILAEVREMVARIGEPLTPALTRHPSPTPGRGEP